MALIPRRLEAPAALLALALVGLPAGALAQASSAAPPLTVMSFNIRYGTAEDGENHWTRRRDLLFEVLRTEDADLVGLQEALRFQIEEIVAAVPGYAVVGVGRDDGRAAGETSAILLRTGRLHVAESGTFWFSDTPDTPGTRTWGNRYNRVSTWARFVDRDGTAFWLYNLHLDHESQVSREKGTALLLERIRARRFPAEPVLVTGDFNADEGNAALRTLLGAPDGAASATPPFIDTFRALYPRETEVGTFSGFAYGKTRGEKIDYVLAPPGTAVLSATIVRTSRDQRYPSDHFPVAARVRLAGSEAAPGR